MIRPTRFLRGLAAAVLMVVFASCRQKQAPVEELFSTRMLGLSYLQRNQLPEAETQFKKLSELAPNDPLGYTNLGLTYLQGGRFADAEKQLKRARELDPQSADIGLMIAKLYALTGRTADARATLEQLQRDTTASARVRYALAELETQASDSGALARREQRLRNVLAVAPANLAVRLQLLDVQARRAESDSAVRQLEELRRIPPEPPTEARAYLDSAIQLLRAGRVPQAQARLVRLTHILELTKPYQGSLD